MDTSSAPYSEQPYPFNLNLDYGRCDYNVGKAFKVFGVWQPVFFHGSNSWMEKIAGGWSLSGIFNLHSGFPWTPMVSVNGGDTHFPPFRPRARFSSPPPGRLPPPTHQHPFYTH